MVNLFDDLKTWKFWKALVAEFLGTFILVFCGTPSCLGKDWTNTPEPVLISISLAFGLVVATVVWAIGHTSGGHINPAVTIALLICRRVGLVRAIFYIVCQLAGAISGAGLLLAVTPSSGKEHLGVTKLGAEMEAYQGFLVELVITFVLLLTVLSSIDHKGMAPTAPLAIGLSVTACHLGFVKYTGASMNPARTFGPAVVANFWSDHWIYWVGPIVGALIAAFLYETLFGREASLSNFCCFTIERRAEGNDESKEEKKELEKV